MQKIKEAGQIVMVAFSFFILPSCGHDIKENKDSVYSRHLQKHIDLVILSTPVPKDKSSFNLLLLNDGQDIAQLRVSKIMDSLYGKKLLQPLVVVAITTSDRMQEYGVAGYPDYQKNGSLAEKYGAFVDDELIPFIKKKSGVRKFHSITIAGCSLGGLSAFDIAWDHANKIDRVGIFSGSFWYRDKDASDTSYADDKDRLIINKIKTTRKRPHLKYWFYAGGSEETADRDNDGIIDVVDDARDLVDLIKQKNVCPPEDIIYTEVKEGIHDYNSWSKVFPRFLLWADGK
ncbi:MAG: alpha/beta hydrolase-fold protein [Ginsengibacter sp.]